MSEKKISPAVKMGLELGPIVLFFIAYTRIKDREFEILGSTYDGFIRFGCCLWRHVHLVQ